MVSGGVALPVKCSPRLDNYCQSRRSIRDRHSTTEQCCHFSDFKKPPDRQGIGIEEIR